MVPLILNIWNEEHWIKPELIEQPGLMQVIQTLHFENDPVNDPVKLTDRQNMILQMFHEDKTLSRERLGLYDASAKRDVDTRIDVRAIGFCVLFNQRLDEP